MSSTYHHCSMMIFCLSYPLCHLEFQVHMTAQWMALTTCAMVTLRILPKPQISKTTLDCLFDDLRAQVISNVRIITAITCIANQGMCNNTKCQVQLISHLLWVMLPLLDPLLSVRYADHYLCVLFCIMLAYFISTPHLLRCQGLAFILVCKITLYPMVYAVNH